MPIDYVYPDSIELRAIEQDKIARLTQDRPIFEIFPIREVDDWVIAWEQLDNYRGLQQLRGLNGAPPKVSKTGLKRFTEEPGVYGEFEEIDERELTRRRRIGTFNQPIDIEDLVVQAQDKLILRRLDRIESIGWTLLAAGIFSVPSLSGAIAHTAAYQMQQYAPTVPWATSLSATPLLDFRNIKLLGRGHSVVLDRTAKAYMNSSTANRLYANQNQADLYGRRTMGLGTYNSPEQINQLLLGDNLPQIVEYDETYLDETNAFQLFIPTGTVIVVGRRPSGVPVGEYIMTRNVNNPSGEPGAYTRTLDRGENTVPRSVEVHDGHNGGPTLLYGSAVVRMQV